MTCSSCRSAICTCGCSVSGVATPYYQRTPMCKEDHTQYIVEPRFSFGVCPTVGWNVPACGLTAQLSVEGIYGAVPGSYIWHPQFGYFEINAVDTVNNTLSITNTCTDGNAAPGTQIPNCTCFIVTIPPLDLNQVSGVCVEYDFVAPVQNVPLDIILTSTEGLRASDTVQIGTGFYFIQEIKPDNVVTIVNQGQGITPGTPVIAKDANGEYQYCLSIIASNPCDREPLQAGVLLACDEEGVTRPLGSPCEVGYIPVSIETADGCQVEMQPAITPQVCTRLTSPVNIVNTDPTYTITVNDASGLALNELLIISGMPSGSRSEITAIVGNDINITVTPTPSTSYELPVGTLVCVIGCCEQLERRLVCEPVVYVDDIPDTLYENIVPSFSGDAWEHVVDAAIGNSPYTTPDDGCEGEFVWEVEAWLQFICILPHTADLVDREATALYNELHGYINDYPTPNRGHEAWFSYSNDLYSGLPQPPGYPVFAGTDCIELCPGSTVDGTYKSLAYRAGHIHIRPNRYLPPATQFNISLVFRAVQPDIPPDFYGTLSVWVGGSVFYRRG